MTTPAIAQDNPAPDLSETMREGLHLARLALERLFAPAPTSMERIEGWPSALAMEQFPDPAVPHLGVAFDVTGPVQTRLVVLAGPGDDTRFAAALLRRPWAAHTPRDTDARAAFAEMANILASSFLNGLARELKQTLIPSVPELTERPLAEVISAITAAPTWGLGARFTITLPSGETSGLFVAAPNPLPAL